jgi:hypothetical protein
MRRIAYFLLIASPIFAQQKPPKAVDEALRARVKEFYQYHVDEQYRKAEKLVAEDSADIFYVREKPKYEGFEIKSIEYRNNFKTAKVTVTVQKYGHGQGFNGLLLKTPSLSSWKLEKGQWMWYADPEELARGPFGKSANAGTKPPPGSAVPQMKVPDNAGMAMGMVKVDKTSVVVKPGITETLTITNGSTGTVGLDVLEVLPDVKITLDKKSLNKGETAVATLVCGDNPHAGEIGFLVTPTQEVLRVQSVRK